MCVCVYMMCTLCVCVCVFEREINYYSGHYNSEDGIIQVYVCFIDNYFTIDSVWAFYFTNLSFFFVTPLP